MELTQPNTKQGDRRLFKRAVMVWVAGLLVHSILWLPAVRAGSSPQDDVTDLSLEDLRKVQVYSASMYLQGSREAPSSVTVVADEIRKCGYRTLADILRSVRGCYVCYHRNYS